VFNRLEAVGQQLSALSSPEEAAGVAYVSLLIRGMQI
jgi:hypothetical protein